jgi:hypothetical protein
MLRCPSNPNCETLNEIILAKCFRELKPHDRVAILYYYLCKNLDVLVDDVTLETILFPEISRKIIVMILIRIIFGTK